MIYFVAYIYNFLTQKSEVPDWNNGFAVLQIYLNI